jgi:hypothetical protein
MFSKTKRLLEVTVIFNKSNTFGLQNDATLLQRSLAGLARVRFADPLEPPVASDVNIHLEVPIYTYVPWSNYNVFIANPEQYVKDSYDPYMKHFDIVITKEDLQIQGAHILPWTLLSFPKTKVTPIKEFLYLIGGSQNKRKASKELLSVWKAQYPVINVYSIEPLDSIIEQSNIKYIVKNLSQEERHTLLQTYQGHIAFSLSEGFGYTAAEGEYCNAYTILNTLPVYIQDYKESKNVAWLQTATLKNNITYPYGSFVSDFSSVEADLEKAIQGFENYKSSLSNTEFKQNYFKKRLLEILDTLPKTYLQKPKLPPILNVEECPPISVITLMYNRRRFFDLACHNIMISDYPKDKIEWILVEDSDNPNEDSSDKIISSSEQSKPLEIVYLPLKKKTSIAEKRNLGVLKAKNDIILFMDDDDHYPITSFRRRVAWLTLHRMKSKATVCTTIACYDLKKGISAVNSPPFDLPLGQRISEATLTCYKSWFLEQKFDKTIHIGEGDSLIKGRESDVMEIPPQQILVAFSHGNNASSRRIPSNDSVEPSCFWGFPQEYLKFIHSLANVSLIT